MVLTVLESHTWTEQDEGSIPSSSKGGIMKYRTKVRELEAIQFDGTNIEAINTLTGLQFKLMETLNVKYLLCGGGSVNLGDWVGVEDGKIKILGAAELENDYTPVLTKEQEMKTIYISGPMKNMTDGNMPAFDEAEKQLKQLGFDVLNPHKICEKLNTKFFGMGKSPEYEDYLKEDIIQMLSKCDTVLVLPGWRGSEGSKCEIANAIACGLDVVFDISDV
jgi:hypothetical protein